jgi:hypothetical protein
MNMRVKGPGAPLQGATRAESTSKAAELRADDSIPAPRAKARSRQEAWRARNPLAYWSHQALRSGLKRGLVTKQPCEECGDPDAEAHHEDHAKPLDVMWFCRSCHKRHHAAKAKRRAGA